MKVKVNNSIPQTSFTGIYNSKMLKMGLEFAAKNSSLFTATVSLGFSTAARPAAILLTPDTDKENKKYACAKSLSSSAAGYLLMLLGSVPVAKAVENIDKNPAKYLKNKTIENLKQGEKILSHSKKYKFATQLFKLGLGFVIAVPKSILTCALIPPIMAGIFHKKTPDKNRNDNHNITFEGSYSKGTQLLSKGFGKIMDTEFIQKMSDKFYKTNFEQHIISLTDVLLTGTFIKQTKDSKKIEDSRKKALMYNAGISTGLSIAGGYAINRLLKKPTENFIKKFSQINKHDAKLDKYLEGIRIAKPALILGTLYYIIIPLISTFAADRFDDRRKKQC